MGLRDELDTMTTGQRRLSTLTSSGGGSPRMAVPVVLLRGTSVSPLIAVISGVHGDEYDGIHASADVIQSWEQRTCPASLVIVPIANLAAFEARQRRTPHDDLDLNRVFPGNAQGSFTERLAYLLFDSMVRHADFVLSLHGWFRIGEVVDYVEAPSSSSSHSWRCASVAARAGFPLIRDTGWRAGTLGWAATDCGIPMLEAELGGSGISEPVRVKRYLDYLWRAIEAIAEGQRAAGGPGHVERTARFFSGQEVIRSSASGLWCRRVDPGVMVEAGELVGEIALSPHLSNRMPAYATVAGLVGAVRKQSAVVEGDEILWLFHQIKTYPN